MKLLYVPIACGIALALMAGATTAHYFSVKQTVTLAQLGLGNGPAQLASEAPAGRTETLAVIEELRKQNASLEQSLDQPATLGNTSPSTSDSELTQLLKELVGQNKYLRDQMAETNRDMMVLQFQVDSQSEDFRPLNLVSEDEGDYDTSIGVLPPRDIP